MFIVDVKQQDNNDKNLLMRISSLDMHQWCQVHLGITSLDGVDQLLYYFTHSDFASRAVVSYWRKYVHEVHVLVNR